VVDPAQPALTGEAEVQLCMPASPVFPDPDKVVMADMPTRDWSSRVLGDVPQIEQFRSSSKMTCLSLPRRIHGTGLGRWDHTVGVHLG
jgi:hypothetical protein